MKQIKVECTPEGYALISEIIDTVNDENGCLFPKASAEECRKYNNCSECVRAHLVFEIKERIE